VQVMRSTILLGGEGGSCWRGVGISEIDIAAEKGEIGWSGIDENGVRVD
jgi:hypothetical protein